MTDMGLNELLELTSAVAVKILPILGVIALIFLIIFLKRLAAVVVNADTVVSAMKETLDTTNRQLETLDKPLNTLNELSDTVDAVHEASKTAVKSAVVAIIENFSTIKDWALTKTQKHVNEDRSEEHGTDETAGY
jgi:predicted PurR-regulated permease PerM